MTVDLLLDSELKDGDKEATHGIFQNKVRKDYARKSHLT